MATTKTLERSRGKATARRIPSVAQESAPSSVAARTGSPPVGSIGEDAVERLIAQWVKRPKQPADFARLPRAALLRECESLLRGREDLKEFRDAAAPINGRAFDYLEMLCRMTALVKAGSGAGSPKRKPRAAAAKTARGRAMDALVAVLGRAEASGRPVRLYELSRVPWSHAGFIVQLLHVVQAGRRRVEKWDNPVYVLSLFARLESAALQLEAAWGLPPTAAPESSDEERGMALDRLLYDGVTYLSAYGRAVFPRTDARRERYLLLQLFPPQARPVISDPMTLLSG
jgi:hypothetical protein